MVFEPCYGEGHSVVPGQPGIIEFCLHLLVSHAAVNRLEDGEHIVLIGLAGPWG